MWWVYRAIDALFVGWVMMQPTPETEPASKWWAFIIALLIAEALNAVIRYLIRRFVPIDGTVLPPERSPSPASTTLGPSATYIDQEGYELVPPGSDPRRPGR